MSRRVVAVMLPTAVRMPVVGQRVRVVGDESEFLVVRVDQERLSADLMRMSSIRRVEEGVPLHALRPLENDGRARLQSETKVRMPE